MYHCGDTLRFILIFQFISLINFSESFFFFFLLLLFHSFPPRYSYYISPSKEGKVNDALLVYSFPDIEEFVRTEYQAASRRSWWGGKRLATSRFLVKEITFRYL